MSRLNRRAFVKQSAGAAAAVTLLGPSSALAANNKVIVGLMGAGGRGTQLIDQFARRPDVEVAYVCDADTRRARRAQGVVEKAQGRQPKLVQDFRSILDDPGVQVLVNATPDHWHALGTILACQAGKDVYVEKPMAYNVWEGRKMIQAARKYQRVVQVGTQTRSGPYVKAAKDYIQSGNLGQIHLVRVFNMMQHPAMSIGPDQPVPEALDYELWSGPAAKLPYNPSRRWLNMWEYSCGAIAGDAVHQLDLARFVMGDPAYPKTVSHAGGIWSLRDGRDTPDTQFATYQYEGFALLFQASLWSPYMKKTPMDVRDSDKFPNWPFSSTKIEILGTKGFMYLGRHGGGWHAYDGDDRLVESVPGRQADSEHKDNFLSCVRSRDLPNADVEQGHYSVLLCHLANIAWRVGNRQLTFDPQTETFPETPEANRYLQRKYRAPWIIPEQV